MRLLRTFQKCRVLAKLTREGEKSFGQMHAREAFEESKLRLTITPILSVPDESGGLFIHSDASGRGLDCVLMQRGKVIAYASRQLKLYHPSF